MSFAHHNSTAVTFALLLCALVLLLVAPAQAQTIPGTVEVTWQTTRTVFIPGATQVLVLDEDVTHAEVGQDVVRFTGLLRQRETVAFVWVNGSRSTIVVSVVEPPKQMLA